MGAKESHQVKDFEIDINHPRLAKSKIVARDSQKYLEISQAIDEREYEKWKAALDSSKNTKDTPFNLLIPTSYSFSRAGFCGNTGTLLITYENYPYLLAEEIYNRRGLKGKFSETELWSFLLAVTEGRRQALALGERLGDIRPKNIFFNQKGNIKISCSLSWPLEDTNIIKAFNKIPTYLSPEDLQKIKRGEVIDAPNDPSEAFSLGLSVLSAANLTDYEDIYDLQVHQLSHAKLNEALRLWAFNSTYSQVLRGTVLLLLNVHPERRLSCSELGELLVSHAEQILKKENFIVDNAPPKLHEEIQHLRNTLTQATLPQNFYQSISPLQNISIPSQSMAVVEGSGINGVEQS